MNKKFIVLMLFVLFSRNVFANNGNHKHPEPNFSEQKAEKVLGLLDLSKPELAEVQQAYDKKEFLTASEKLLQYYRDVHHINFYLDRRDKISAGKPSDGDRKYADDAMRHCLPASSKYPIYFRGWDIDWKTNPVKDIEWIAHLHRIFWWDCMGKVYWQAKDEKYAKEWVYQFFDWADKNPCDANDKIMWGGMQVGYRLIHFAEETEYFIDSPAFTPTVLINLLDSIYIHNEHLFNRYSGRSNHTLVEAKGALFSSIYFSLLRDSSKWRHKAIAMLTSGIDSQVLPDGMQWELSMFYHKTCATNFLVSYQLAVQNGYGNEFPKHYVQVIQKMTEASYKTLLPDFTMPQFGDCWKETPEKIADAFKKWNAAFNREDLLYFATLGTKGQAPQQKNFALTDSGYYSMRSGWLQDDTCIIFKCGPQAKMHAQPDNGSFELYALGRYFMPDSGCYTYHGDPNWRNWFRQTSVHQTLTLGNKDTQCKPQLLMWQVSDDMTTLVVKNQSYENLSHRRAVFFINEKFFVIADRAEGSADGNVAVHFQFKEGKSVIDVNNLTARTDFEDGNNLLVKTKSQSGIKMQTEEGWVSYVYNEKLQRPAFCYTLKKNPEQKDIDFITVLLPYEDKIPNISIDKFNSNESIIEFEITIDGKIYKVECDLNKKSTKFIP